MHRKRMASLISNLMIANVRAQPVARNSATRSSIAVSQAVFAPSSTRMETRSMFTKAKITVALTKQNPQLNTIFQMNRSMMMTTEAYNNESATATAEVKLYIGNLSWDMSDSDLQNLFAQYGASDCVIVMDKMTGRSRGFGFATVPDQESADSCIAALNETEQYGRQMRVTISTPPESRPPREDRPQRGERAPRGDRPAGNWDADGRKVYFGNLSWGMDHLDLQDLCAEFGNVDESRLITDRETGRSRGFGFVTMSTEKEAEDVVAQLNGQDVDGRVLKVNIAVSNKDDMPRERRDRY